MSNRVLILCTGNSCRSQIAEGLWKAETNGQWEVHSAGSNPAAAVHPLAIEAASEVGVDLSANKTKHLDQFRDQSFDLVVTVCDKAANNCPVFLGARQTLHWPFDDPAHAEGSHEERLAVFRKTRDEIQARIRTWLADNNSTAGVKTSIEQNGERANP